MVTSIQDRTIEFRSILTQAQKRKGTSKVGAQRQNLLSDAQRKEANGSPDGSAPGERRARSEFARNAVQIGRGITATMGKLERLAQRTSLLSVIGKGKVLTYRQWRAGRRFSTTGL